MIDDLNKTEVGGAYIYGLGSYAKNLVTLFGEMGIDFHGFIDYTMIHSEHETNLNPKFVQNSKVVVLGFHNYQADIARITHQLELDGFEVINVVQFALLAKKKNVSIKNYWLTNEIEIYKHESKKIEQALDLFDEIKSRQLYSNIVDYRQTGNLDLLNLKDGLTEQYFPTDLDWINSLSNRNVSLSILDGGAFHGETFMHAREFLNIAQWVFVEPDPRNVPILTAETSETTENKVYLESALHSRKMNISFDLDNNSYGSKISRDGQHQILSVTINDIYNFGKSQLDFIKLDVEGSELNAILGGVETILQQRPHLAISTYHKPSDHWELPIYIKTNFPFYELFLRVHGEQTFDTVLYCIPKLNK